MRHAKALVAALLAISSATATAATDPLNNPTDEQTACRGGSAGLGEANAAITERATAEGSMSIEDTIAQRRLTEDFCKRWAACLITSITAPGLRENALRSTFAGCLSSEAEEHFKE
jgi:hypothetical protein